MTIRILVLALLAAFALTSCNQVPNVPICAQDAPGRGVCVWTLQGDDFHVDNTGARQYTQNGHSWSWQQLQQNSLVMPPESWAAFKTFILNTCHDYPSECTVTQVQARLEELEKHVKVGAP